MLFDVAVLRKQMSGTNMIVNEKIEDFICEEEDDITDGIIQMDTVSSFKDLLYNDDGIDNEDVLNNFAEEIITNDLLSHVLVTNKNLSEINGHVFETYHCQQCDIEYPNKDKFVETHSDGIIAMINDETATATSITTLDAQPFKVIDNVEDLIENAEDLIEMVHDENVLTHDENIVTDNGKLALDNSNAELEPALQIDHYICCDCQQVFIDVIIAQQHECSKGTAECKAKIIKSDYNNVEETTAGIIHNCYYCQQCFPNNDELRTHMEKCELKNTKCDEKEKKTEKENEIIELDSQMYVNVFHCDICSQDFTTLRAFSNHKRTHKNSIINSMETVNSSSIAPVMTTPSICDICKTEFSSSKNLKLHMKIHRKPGIKSIQDALPVGAQNEYSDIDQFYCEICNKSFDQNLLTVHRNMHQNIKVHNCSKCNRKFDNTFSYEIHLQMHKEMLRKNELVSKQNFNNNTNHQISNTREQQQHHQQQQQELQQNNIMNDDGNADGRKKFPCQFCGREFRRPYEKVKHERIHTGEKPYECEVCGKKFRVPYSLTLHLRTHTDIRPYVCSQCNKRYKSHSVYIHHIKTHTNERLYKCDTCNKSFRTSVQLCGHKNSHKKPFICTECNRSFASLYAVKIHMKTHNKPQKMNKNSKNSNNLKSLKNSKNLKNDCKICGANYTHNFALRCHLKQQHAIDLSKTICMENKQSDGYDDDDNSLNYNYIDEQNFSTYVIYENIHDNITTDHTNTDIHFDDETTAATQSILNTDHIITDNLPSEEIIITDWLNE